MPMYIVNDDKLKPVS